MERFRILLLEVKSIEFGGGTYIDCLSKTKVTNNVDLGVKIVR